MATNLQKLTTIAKTLANHGYETRKLIGSLANLKTTQKENVVSAINELFDLLAQGTVNETRVNQLIEAKILALTGEVPEELNTLQEIATQLKAILQELADDDTALSNLLSKLASLQTRVEALEGLSVDIPDSLVTEIENILATGRA